MIDDISKRYRAGPVIIFTNLNTNQVVSGELLKRLDYNLIRKVFDNDSATHFRDVQSRRNKVLFGWVKNTAVA